LARWLDCRTSAQDFVPAMVWLLVQESVDDTLGLLRDRQKAWTIDAGYQRPPQFISSLAAMDLVVLAKLLVESG
jgi:hypothetical protein